MRAAEEIELEPRGPVTGTVRVPSSKSLTNRALALAALADGRSAIDDPLIADDTLVMVRALRALGAGIDTIGPDGGLEVTGCSGRFDRFGVRLDCGGAGTAMRFLTALSSLAAGEVTLDGDARMRQRPMEPLLEALRSLGVDASSLRGDGCPPVLVRGGTLKGGPARLRGELSSQFASALLMVAPLAPAGVVLEVLPPVVSAPYIELTLSLMAEFGVRPSEPPRRANGGMGAAMAARLFEIEGRGAYRAARFRIPPDASSASYFFAAAAVTGGRVRVLGLNAESAQGDIALLGHLAAMGCRVESDALGATVIGPGPAGSALAGVRPPGILRSFDLDLGATPDLAPTLAVLALFADAASQIRNVPGLRLKESDRLRALAAELGRLGATVEELPDGLRIEPRPLRGARIETYGDHRIAMAFAVAGLAIPGVRIADPGCVAKSFPEFWGTLSRLVEG